MSIRSKAAIVAVLCALAATARGDGLSGSVSPQLGGGVTQFDAGVSVSLTPPTPLTPCGAGQLDFSVATGCNTTQYMVILK